MGWAKRPLYSPFPATPQPPPTISEVLQLLPLFPAALSSFPSMQRLVPPFAALPHLPHVLSTHLLFSLPPHVLFSPSLFVFLALSLFRDMTVPDTAGTTHVTDELLGKSERRASSWWLRGPVLLVMCTSKGVDRQRVCV